MKWVGRQSSDLHEKSRSRKQRDGGVETSGAGVLQTGKVSTGETVLKDVAGGGGGGSIDGNREGKRVAKH